MVTVHFFLSFLEENAPIICGRWNFLSKNNLWQVDEIIHEIERESTVVGCLCYIISFFIKRTSRYLKTLKTRSHPLTSHLKTNARIP